MHVNNPQLANFYVNSDDADFPLHVVEHGVTKLAVIKRVCAGTVGVTEKRTSVQSDKNIINLYYREAASVRSANAHTIVLLHGMAANTDGTCYLRACARIVVNPVG
jgi:hypothetical protein